MSQNHLMHPRVANNHADNGYFPTDDATLAGIAARLDIGGGDIRIFDPCCGTGAALAKLSEHLSACGSLCRSFGVELDAERAADASAVLGHVVRADIENCLMQPKTVGLLFLNPPYGYANRDQLSSESGRRLEQVFLDRTMHVLQEGGILVLIVPVQSLSESFTREIASRFAELRMYRAAVDTYKQVVIFGIKPRLRADIGRSLAKRQQAVLMRPENALPIRETAADCCYEVPPSPEKPFRPISFKVEAAGLAGELATLGSQTLWPHFGQWFAEALSPDKRRPLCALGQWHAALALAAGQVSGIVTAADGRRLLVKGSTYKTKVTTAEEQYGDDGNITVTTTALDRFVPSIRAIDLTVGSDGFGDVLTIK